MRTTGFATGSVLLLTLLLSGSVCRLSEARANEAQGVKTLKYIWTYKYKAAETFAMRDRTQMTSKVEGSAPIELRIRTQYRFTVKEIMPDGNAVIAQVPESMEAVVGSIDIPDDPHRYQTVTQVVTPTGLVVKQTIENAQANYETLNKMGQVLSVLPAPTQPVSIGETWKITVANPLADAKKATISSTLAGKEKLFGGDALKIRIAYLIPTGASGSDKEAIKANGVYFLDPANGRLLRIEMTIENMPIEIGGKPMPFTVVSKSVLVRPGIEDKETKDEDKDETPPSKEGKEDKK